MLLPPRARRLLLTVHLALAVGWVGAVLAYLPLDLTVATSADPASVRSAFAGMDLIARTVLAPLAIASFVTGVLLGLGSPWGLFRHYWVLISLLLTGLATVVLLVETQTIRAAARLATDPATPDGAVLALNSTLPHSVGGLAVLLVVLVLNMYKPRGLTRYGWRKQQEERRGSP